MNRSSSFGPLAAALLFSAPAMLLVLAGCESGPDKAQASPPFPALKKQTETVDIQVARENTTIVLTNTTATPIPPCTMWLNGSFARPLPGLNIGESIRLDLDQFRNEYGERFRAGGFFAFEPPDQLVLAQFETEDRLIGLVVVQGKGQ